MICIIFITGHARRDHSSKQKGFIKIERLSEHFSGWTQTMPARCLYTLTAIRSVLLSWCKLYMHSPLIKSMKMTHLTVPVFYPHISKLCLIICNEEFKHCNLFRISLTYSFNCWTVLLICQLFVNPRLQYMLFSSTVVNFHCTIQMSLYVCIDVSAKRKSTRRSTAV